MPHLALCGGPKLLDMAWPRWPVWGDEERQALSAVLESGDWWYGAQVRAFEERFAAFQGARYGVTCSSGTTGLEAALLALGVGAGDEVIVPPYTFIATASAVLRVGALPIFADIEPDTLCLDPDDVARKITPRTRCVIPVHLAGRIANMDRLGDVADAQGLAILEDACHAWGSAWRGKGAGTLGRAGVFSFQASKNITSGEGGIIVTDDEDLAECCRSYTNCGRVRGGAWYEHQLPGSNLRLTEFQAAILLAQLARLEEQTLQRQANARLLDEGLAKVPGVVTLRPEPRMTRRSYHLYPFRLDLEYLGISRERFVQALEAEGVPASAGYSVPLYQHPLFAGQGGSAEARTPSWRRHRPDVDYGQVSCPVCERVCEDTCWLPQWALLASAEAMEGIVAAVAKVVAHAAELR